MGYGQFAHRDRAWNEMRIGELLDAVDQDREAMVESLVSMLKVKAVGPESGGEGEHTRAEYLLGLASKLGFRDVELLESDDPRVPSGKRPNIVLRLAGANDKTLWVVTHMDTVPEGDLSAWKYPPYEPEVFEGRIYGRGAEDNGQELIASLYGLRAVMSVGLTPEYNIGLALVADEEYGNTHGIDFLLSRGLFCRDDAAVVPDHGIPDGGAIIIVEKGSAWINVEVVGRQTHGSTPEKGINALETAASFMLQAVRTLRAKFSDSDPLFEPPTSTFVPTRCEANGPNINTVPGRQVFAFDFRILPVYPLDDVMTELRAVARACEEETGAKINLSYLERGDPAPKTSPDSDIVRRLTKAVEAVTGIRPRLMGMGGGTCAAPFRRAGIDAAVWSTIPETAHDANEFANVDDLVTDAKVYAVLFAGKSISSD